MSETKECNMCKQILPIDNFALVGDKHGSRRGKCKPCQTEHYQRSKGTWEEYQKEKSYREELHLLQKEGKRRCRICKTIKPLDAFHNDKSKKVFYNKKSYCSCCAEIHYQKPYRQSDIGRAKKSIADKKYRSKPSSMKRINEQRYEKYHSDPAFKIKHLLRTRINKIVDRKKVTKSFARELGCTFDELVDYLESQFYNNPETGEKMTWDNHEQFGWHVDHIKELHKFDLEDDKQFKEAAHYTNLRPLWWKENLRRNKK